ncbi:hypothetical protein I3842_09G111800 [Carya illinoinensis]|uniref:Uncharacterized protein n=1 Tax=Carya illinoinensis TaxID=32201 RepID=A0A922J765_CARIL|nr:hypothetical protein I3842_09G111800 [Carya illinoinensis]
MLVLQFLHLSVSFSPFLLLCMEDYMLNLDQSSPSCLDLIQELHIFILFGIVHWIGIVCGSQTSGCQKIYKTSGLNKERNTGVFCAKVFWLVKFRFKEFVLL